MLITIRNITKDTMIDFNNDHTLNLPMDEEKLREFLGHDEWIIVDSPIGEELTDIIRLNNLLKIRTETDVLILGKSYLIDEIINNDFIIVDFDDETSSYDGGHGVFADDWWKGYVLHDLGYEQFPFEYKLEMEDYLKFEQLWYTAESEGWREIRYNNNNNTYLVRKV